VYRVSPLARSVRVMRSALHRLDQQRKFLAELTPGGVEVLVARAGRDRPRRRGPWVGAEGAARADWRGGRAERVEAGSGAPHTVRLYLRDGGKPTLVILDDALVNTDAMRLNQMKRVLYGAAERHRILLFSCHP